MQLDDQFEDLIDSLGGFYRTWLIHLGLDLGLFAALRAAGPAGLTPEDLAAATATTPAATSAWAWAADAHGLAELDEHGRLVSIDAIASILLDADRVEHLGGQFTHAVVASLDWDAMPEFFRSGQALMARPERYRTSIERLTAQDIAVFFQEALAALPQLVDDLERGARLLDVHCGGGMWLVAMARRFARVGGLGVETEVDSVERARQHIAAAGLAGRLRVEHGEVGDALAAAPFDLVYYQYALHALGDPVASLRAAWGVTRTDGGRLLVLDWPLPSTPEEFRTRHGELIAGVQLDAMLSGRRLVPREQFVAWFEAAGLPRPTVVDLPSGASIFLAECRAAQAPVDPGA